jgi:two-component system, NarL family, invasion response regulator UvrY
MKFLLIDDHKIIREGLKQILLMHFPSATFDEGASAEEVMKNISDSDYDLVLCDLSMPGRSGLDVLKQVKETKPNLRVLILSMHPDEHYAVRAIKAGAWGYVNKSDGAEVLIPAVQRILQGRKFIPTDLAERLADNLSTDDKTEDRLHENLSSREFDIFKLLVEGKSISDISQQLSLGMSTVSTHRARILTKMNMKSNAELVKYAIQNNLV